MNQHKVYLSLGSNMGNKLDHLQQAVHALYSEVGSIKNIAPIYETQAWGFSADTFLNTVVEVCTSLDAESLLKKIEKIEKQLGRKSKNTEAYESRCIDIDILYYNNLEHQTKQLTIPHPEMHLRKFVLQPLCDIAPSIIHPKLNKSTQQLLESCADVATITKAPHILKHPMSYLDLSKHSFIAIEGNIGAGKTTLAKKIAADFNAKLVLERFADNPFLPKFYKDQQRYAFALEMSFLAERYQQVQDDLNQLDLFKDFIVSDYDIYKSLIFAQVTLQEEEFKLYRRLFEMMYKDTKRPELYVFLYQTPEKLIENIKKRGRVYEQNISPSYLESIQRGYLNFIQAQPNRNIKIIDITEMDFVKNQSDYVSILNKIAE